MREMMSSLHRQHAKIVSDDDSPILRETVHLDKDRRDGLGISKLTVVDDDTISGCARSRRGHLYKSSGWTHPSCRTNCCVSIAFTS